MNISISNIAWHPSEDEKVAKLLNKYNVNQIDIAPGKYFTTIETVQADAKRVKHFWNSHGINVVGMQSLLFGTSGLNVFGSETTREATIDHLSYICKIAEIVGVDKLTFGSPKNRNREGLSDKETMRMATELFRIVGTHAEFYNVTLCLEPNPTIYGANFMTTTQETIDVVRAVNHPNIKLQLDLGAVTCNEENLKDIVSKNYDIIGHIHISEPHLITIGDIGTPHVEYAKILKQYLPGRTATIEMLTDGENNLREIETALQRVCAIYK